MSFMITDRSNLDDEAKRMSARLDLALGIAARKSARRRPEDTSRTPRTMWDLLRWTYGAQQVRGRLWSVSRWSDVLFALEMQDGPACPYHIDAVVVHAAVSMLPPHQREAVWHAAEAMRLPAVPDPKAQPRFEPVMRRGPGRPGPRIDKYWMSCDPPKLRPDEIKALERETDSQQRTVTRYENNRGQGGTEVKWTYRVDPRPVTAKRQAKQVVMRDVGTGRVRGQVAVQAEVLVPFCPIAQTVSAVEIIGRHEAYASFVGGVVAVHSQLEMRMLFGTEMQGVGLKIDVKPCSPTLYGIATRREKEIVDWAWPMQIDH